MCTFLGACSCVEYGALEFKRADLLFVKSSRFHHFILSFFFLLFLVTELFSYTIHSKHGVKIVFLSFNFMPFPVWLASFLAISAAAGASPLVYPTLAARHNSLEAHSKYPTAVYILTYRLCFCMCVYKKLSRSERKIRFTHFSSVKCIERRFRREHLIKLNLIWRSSTPCCTVRV